MDYTNLFSRNIPAPMDFPAALMKPARYVFSVTYTDPDTLPAEEMWEEMREAMRREGRDLALYPLPQGHAGLRELIAQNLKRKRGAEVDADSIFLSSGAGGAIQCILDAFIEPGDVVLLEEFSYLGTLFMLLQRRAQVVHVPCDDQGMNTDALESVVKKLASQGVRPKLIYTISVYQNPMGFTLSAERRRHMLDISQRYGIPIVENESYADFRIDGDPLPPAMLGMDSEDSVMYVSAYTKFLGCGLRLGYGVAPEPVRQKLGMLRFGGSPSHLAAMMVYEYLKGQMDTHVEDVRVSLKAKRDAMLAALGESFPPGCAWTTPGGGMMVWARLPDGADTVAALDKAVEAGVKYTPGPLFHAERHGKNYLRLTYSYNTPDEIREGVSILADVFQREELF
jgi:2-aminoadipate transaminase